MDNTKLIRGHFTIDPQIRKLISYAKTDLYNGPLDPEEVKETDDFDYPGFQSACQRIQEALEDVLHEVWVDDMAEVVLDKEPDFCQGHEDAEDTCDLPLAEDFTHYTLSKVRWIVVGKELKGYIW